MNDQKKVVGKGTHAASFRISESMYQEFQALLSAIPGAEVGNLYREIFARGLKSLQVFYQGQGLIRDHGGEEQSNGGEQ